MYFKKIFMDETGALSYLIGCVGDKTACVVDPKRGAHEYLEAAHAFGMTITHIFDTRDHTDSHLNGTMELKLKTGAEVYYLKNPGENPSHCFAQVGDSFQFGTAELQIVYSPIHDPFNNVIMVSDTSDPEAPWTILTAFSLFIGDLCSPEANGSQVTSAVDLFLSLTQPDGVEMDAGGFGYDKYASVEDRGSYATAPLF